MVFLRVFSCFTFIITGGKQKQVLQIIKGIIRKKKFSFHRGQIVFLSKKNEFTGKTWIFRSAENAILQGKRSKWFLGPIRVNKHFLKRKFLK